MKGLGRFVLELLLPLRMGLVDVAAFRVLLSDLGWSVVEELLDPDDLPGFSTLPSLVTELEQFVATIESGGDDAAATAVVSALQTAESILAVADELRGWQPPANLVGSIDAAELGNDIATYLPGLLLSRWIEGKAPAAHALLLLLGVLIEDHTIDGRGLPRPRTRIDWDQVDALLSGSGSVIMERFDWGDGEWLHKEFVEYLHRIARGVGLRSRTEMVASTFTGDAPAPYEAVPIDVRQAVLPVVSGFLGASAGAGFAELGLAVVPVPQARGGPVDSLVITNHTVGAAAASVDLGAGWILTSSISATTTGVLQLKMVPGQPVALDAAAPDVEARFDIASPARDWVLFGTSDATHFVVRGVGVGIALTSDPPDLVVSAHTRSTGAGQSGIGFVLDAGDADGFVGSILGGSQIEAGLDLSATWSLVDGLTVNGAGGLAIEIPLGLKIGPVEVDDIELVAQIGGSDGEVLALTAGATLGATIGPLAISVDGLGLSASLTTGANPMVQIGEIGINIGFKPPEGLGIGVDLGVVAGGGYLWIDADAGSYAGVLDLEIMSVGISAVAIIDTKLPDVDGWSMFFALFLDLPSIQLGFGFTLNGVGGVAGINRAIDVDALGSAVRSGSLDTILFPEDPIADAPIIIDAFRSIFPPADGSYVFGPIVKLGWGTPPLIEAELGIVIQLPDPLVIVVLGSLSAVLPTAEAALVELHLDVAGAIDFEAGTLSVDASLHDSHVVGFALSGDMALRAEFGNAQAFLMSVGGFHPRFDPPGDFPVLRRVTFGINAGSLLRIDFEAYFALTSNSVQCGARFTLDAEVMGFGVYGSAGFDAMIEFSPFRLITSIDFEISITAAGVDLMGVMLYASVEGPNVWHIIGTARFEVLGFGKDIRVDEMIGAKENEPAVEAADVLEDLLGTLETEEAWNVIQVNDPAVTLTEITDPEAPMYANPDALIEVRQKYVPLGIAIQRFGDAPVGDHTLFDIEPDGGEQTATLDDWFAPGHFFPLSDDEKLEGPEFELMRSGLQFGGIGAIAGPDVGIDTDYKAYILDPEFPDNDIQVTGSAVYQGAAGVAATPVTSGGFTAKQKYTVGTVAPMYAVVDDRGETVGPAHVSTWTEAYAHKGSGTDLHIERVLADTGMTVTP